MPLLFWCKLWLGRAMVKSGLERIEYLLSQSRRKNKQLWVSFGLSAIGVMEG